MFIMFSGPLSADILIGVVHSSNPYAYFTQWTRQDKTVLSCPCRRCEIGIIVLSRVNVESLLIIDTNEDLFYVSVSLRSRHVAAACKHGCYSDVEFGRHISWSR